MDKRNLIDRVLKYKNGNYYVGSLATCHIFHMLGTYYGSDEFDQKLKTASDKTIDKIYTYLESYIDYMLDHPVDDWEQPKHNVKVEVWVTKTFKFRAKVSKKTGVPYEVTVGGESWKLGKGREYKEQIVTKVKNIQKRLNLEAEKIYN